MQFARERILEEERLAKEVTRIMAGEEDFEDPDMAGEDSEDPDMAGEEDSENPDMAGAEDSEDPDDPQFRPAGPQVGHTGSSKNKKKKLPAVHRCSLIFRSYSEAKFPLGRRGGRRHRDCRRRGRWGRTPRPTSVWWARTRRISLSSSGNRFYYIWE